MAAADPRFENASESSEGPAEAAAESEPVVEEWDEDSDDEDLAAALAWEVYEGEPAMLEASDDHLCDDGSHFTGC